MNNIQIPHVLAIDAGNTRVKWALFDSADHVLESGACLHSALAETILPKANKVIISNVAGDTIANLLKLKLSDYPQVDWIISQKNACGVNNGYDNPAMLGTDRWAALIAAWHLQKSTCVIMNAGTAVTIDAVIAENNRGQFIGGIILPGLNLMQKSLGLATAQLPKHTDNSPIIKTDSTQILSTHTQEAIYKGALYAIVGALLQVVESVTELTQQKPVILLSGGDAAVIKASLLSENRQNAVTNSMVIVDNLVLQGLFILSNVMQSDAQ